MSSNAKILTSAFLLLLVVFGWAYFQPQATQHSHDKSEKSGATADPINNAPKQASVPDQENGAGESQLIQPYARTPYLGMSDPRWIERKRLRDEDPSYQWRTPIVFYGKVIDERGQSVPSARVEISWNGNGVTNGGVGHRTLSSDAEGEFVIKGIKGKGMTVRVSKLGYYTRKPPADSNWFEYAAFWEPSFIEPDPNHPVIFNLVKRPVAEPTYSISKRALIPPPTWTTHIDLLSESVETASAGDLTLQIKRPPNPGYQNLFDWELQVEGLGGAKIVESSDEFMLRAPDDGYQKSLSKAFKDARGGSIETIKFYVRNKARGLYAAVSLEVTPYYPNPRTKEDTSCIIVTGTVNPNNSPNLEYDSKMNIREMQKQ